MKPISSAASNTPLSLIRVIFNRIIGMDDVISFAVGEPDFGTPPHVIDAATATIRNDRIGYTDNSGIKQLREAVAREFHRFDRIDYDPATEIMVTNGGMEGVFLTLAALTNPGDEVLVADPCYANYEGTIALNRCTTVPVPTREETGFDLEEGPLRRAITDRSKVILINSPSNPTGATASRESLEMIARVAVEKDLYVLFDEVYKHLVYGGREYFNIARLPGMKERTFCIDSVSKAYAMTGWRIGYVLGPSEVIKYMPAMQEPMLSCVNAPAQVAATAALDGDQSVIETMRLSYLRRRDLMVEAVNGIDGVSCNTPDGAFYVFMNIEETGLSSEDFALRLLDEQRVAVAPGISFGSLGESYVRLSYATSDAQIHEGMERIGAFVASLRARSQLIAG
jgi:aminotransferase